MLNTPVTIPEFITHNDCQYLIDTYKNQLQHSYTVNSTTNTLEIHPSRTSSSFYFPGHDSVVNTIKQKTADYLNIPITYIEPLQLLRYVKGERYLYHHDYLRGDNITNQRVHTVLVYLNTLDASDGGATSFFHHSLKIQPVEGNAVWFRNADDSGNTIDTSLHSGEEMRTDAVKYAINIWTRQRPY